MSSTNNSTRTVKDLGLVSPRVSTFLRNINLGWVRSGQDSLEDVKPSAIQIMMWAALLIMILGLWFGHYADFQIGVDLDDARYIVLARSLVHEDSYGLTNEPGAPQPHRFPIGYPLHLTIVEILAPGNLEAFKVPSLLGILATVSILFWGWPQLFGEKSYWWGIGMTALFALSPLTIDQTRRVMSEPLFMVYFFTGMLVVEGMLREKRGNAPLTILLGVLLTMLVLTRTIGIVIVASIFLYLFLRRGWRSLPLLAAIILVMILMVGFLMAITPADLGDFLPGDYFEDSHASFLVMLGSRFGFIELEDNSVAVETAPGVLEEVETTGRFEFIWREYVVGGLTQHFGKDLRKALIPIGGGLTERRFTQQIGLPWLPVTLGFTLSTVVLFGFGWWIRTRGVTAANLTAVIYLFALFGWVWNDTRLLYPILPQLLFAFLLGVSAIITFLSRFVEHNPSQSGIQRSLISLTVVVILGISVYRSVTLHDTVDYVGDLRARTDWIRETNDEGAVIMTEAPVVDYLYSGHHTVPYPSNISSPEGLEAFLRGRSVDYVLVAPRILWSPDEYIPTLSVTAEKYLPYLDALHQQGAIAQAEIESSGSVLVYRSLHD